MTAPKELLAKPIVAVTRLTTGSTVRVKNAQKFGPKALFVVLSLPGRNVKVTNLNRKATDGGRLIELRWNGDDRPHRSRFQRPGARSLKASSNVFFIKGTPCPGPPRTGRPVRPLPARFVLYQPVTIPLGVEICTLGCLLERSDGRHSG